MAWGGGCMQAVCAYARKGLVLPRASHSGEIALAGSRRLRSTHAAAPALFAHAVVTAVTRPHGTKQWISKAHFERMAAWATQRSLSCKNGAACVSAISQKWCCVCQRCAFVSACTHLNCVKECRVRCEVCRVCAHSFVLLCVCAA